VYFVTLNFLVPVLFTFDIQGVLKFKSQIPVPKVNMHKATRLHFLSILSRYYPMSESVQRNDQWSSLPDMFHFRYDDQRPSLPAEGLIVIG
jgi:hypothetical protein